MVAYNVTLDDTSPMIEYSGTWSEKHDDDSRTKEYFMKTFASTTNGGNSATLRFNGTGIWAFGAKRLNHGRYTATLDGQANTYAGFASEPGEIQAVLFKQTGLDPKIEHSLVMANADNNWFLDIDYFIVQHEDVDEQYELNVETMNQDAPAPEFYKTTGFWNEAYNGAEYHNKTGMISYLAGDSVTFSFTGTSVAFYGGINSVHGVYSVILDGLKSYYNGWYDGPTTGGVLLFHRANLANTAHTVTVINEAAAPTNYFGIDYVQWNTTKRGTTIAKASSTTGTSTSTSSSVAIALATSLSDTTTTSTSSEVPVEITNVIESSTSDAIPMPSPASAEENKSAIPHSRINLSGGAWAGIAIGAVALIVCVAVIIWRCTKKRSKRDSLYHWEENSAISLISTENDKFSPMTFTASPQGPYQDSPYSGRRQNTGWPATSPYSTTQQVVYPREETLMLPETAPMASLSSFDYYPYAQSVVPPTEAGSPVFRTENVSLPSSSQTRSPRSQALLYAAPSSSALPSALGPSLPGYSDSASAAVSSSLDALLRNYAAPSSTGLPSSLGDPAEIQIASQVQSTRPNLLTTIDLKPASRLQRNDSAASTPSSIATRGSRAAKQMGVSLPSTATMPTSTLSDETLRRMRMAVDGRLRDWGPVADLDDGRSARTSLRTLPPAYAQASL